MAIIYRLVPIDRVRLAIADSTPWIKTVREAELVGTVHGGDSFSDIYGLKGLISTFLMDWTVILVRGEIVQFPQTYGPYKSVLSRVIARFLLNRSSVIIARDKPSQAIAQSIVGQTRNVLFSPDVAFSLESIRPPNITLFPPLTDITPDNVIGLNVNGLMYNGGYTGRNMFGLKLDYPSFLPELVTKLLYVHPGELWLVPHTFASTGDVESDPEASHKLRAALPQDIKDRVRIVDREYDQYEIKGVIGQCNFFVGSRMHACIAALSQGVPCVGIAYSMKFAGVFASMGMDDWVIDGREIGNEYAVQRVIELYRMRNGVRNGLSARADAARAQLRLVFDQLVNRSKISE